MKNIRESGAERGQILEGVLILIALVIIIFLFILPGKGVFPAKSFYALGNQPAPFTGSSGAGTAADGAVKTSPYANAVSIGSGNASYEIQPSSEYITLYNNSSAPVDITGWTLTNGKGDRSYAVGNTEEHYASDSVIIPRAPGFVPPSGVSIPTDVVLEPGDQADITTGSIGNTSPYRITSFKENKCSGYLEALPDYAFTPSLSYACVPAYQEPGASSLDSACRKFLNTLSSCQTPTYNDLVTDSRGQQNVCNGCVNKVSLSQACTSFIQSHENYGACISQHQNDPDFYGTTWHVFLGRTWELWAADHETISLFDSSGKLVDEISY